MISTEKHIHPFATDFKNLKPGVGNNELPGLTNEEAENRLLQFGKNKIEEKNKKNVWLIFLSQFKSPIVGLLAIACGLSYYFEEWLDGSAIAIVILINSAIGFYMELQAERSMNALKQLSTVPSKVIRNGILIETSMELIVPDDIVFVEPGDLVPADGKVFRISQLYVDESALTGESIPVEKKVGQLKEKTILAERTNMLFKGTYVVKGNGYMVISGTGMNTELGKIAKLVQGATQVATPLEKKLLVFSKKMIWITIALVILIFIAGLLNGNSLMSIFQTAVALAVAAIPEGLPIVATLALARGMMKLAEREVIVKKLSAVETMGGTNIICCDKTGTLTQNKIEVDRIVTSSENTEGIQLSMKIAVLCNTAELRNENGKLIETGDPLETGLLKYAVKQNISIEEYRIRFPKIKEEPFSSETKIMCTLHETENAKTIFAKGAPEELLNRCTHLLDKTGITLLSDQLKEVWLQRSDEMAQSGLKVIAGAFKHVTSTNDELSSDLVFVCLYGMIDPPREGVFEAIEECKSAGIKVVMITGDHPSTAKNIAIKLGIMQPEDSTVLSGKEMKNYDQLTEKDKTIWSDTTVFARVSPQQKLDLVKVLQEKNNVVGMTGDGVNDAPALKKADIGIAMGQRGTQVSQEVADMVLKNDSFQSIVSAIREGRVIFQNIRRFVVYLLSCNLSELLVVAAASVFNLHFQLYALQILFINLITDVLPALALGFTGESRNVMHQPPRNMQESIIDRNRWIAIFSYAIVIGSVSIGAVFFSHFTVHDTEIWNPELCNNILFFTLIFSQLLHVFNMTDNKSVFFGSEIFRNKYIWVSIISCLIVIIICYQTPVISQALSVYRMSVYDWMIAAGASLISMLVIQIMKKIDIVKL